MSLPTDPKARKQIPIYSGFIKYFPDAIAAVAQLSFIANEQHNPGQPLRWAKDKSADHLDALMRHMVDELSAGERDTDGVLHAVKTAWRAMAHLQTLADKGVNIFAALPESACVGPPRDHDGLHDARCPVEARPKAKWTIACDTTKGPCRCGAWH